MPAIEQVERLIGSLSEDEASWACSWLEWQLDRTIATRPQYACTSPGVALEQISAQPAASGLLVQGLPPRPAGVLVRSQLPERLAGSAEAPFALWTQGRQELLGQSVLRVGVIGSRRPRAESVQVARHVARGLARAGITVVSGMAIGIDGVAHRAALQAGGATIAVLGSGIDRPYPMRHERLARDIQAGGGLLLSEYGPGSAAYKQRFRDRNRIIAGLCDALVVVQAGERSGSMITARHAANMGVEVGVVPSHIGDTACAGSLNLLRDGARAVIDALSVFRMLGLDDDQIDDASGFEALLRVPRAADELAALVGLPLQETLAELLELELDGVVSRLSDGRYVCRR